MSRFLRRMSIRTGNEIRVKQCCGSGSVSTGSVCVFGPHGSGSISMSYGSGSGSFYKQKCKENLDSFCFVTSLGLFIFEK
jgi:hypothetical protein